MPKPARAPRKTRKEAKQGASPSASRPPPARNALSVASALLAPSAPSCMHSDIGCVACERAQYLPSGQAIGAAAEMEVEAFLAENSFSGYREENGELVLREFTRILDFVSYDGIDPLDKVEAFKNGRFLVEWPDREEPGWEESRGFWDHGMVGCWEFLEKLIRDNIDKRMAEIEKEKRRREEEMFAGRAEEERRRRATCLRWHQRASGMHSLRLEDLHTGNGSKDD